MKKIYRNSSQTISGSAGPGGMRCPCCGVFAYRKAKKLTHRALRRQQHMIDARYSTKEE